MWHSESAFLAFFYFVMKTKIYYVLTSRMLGDCTNHGLSSLVTGGHLFWDCTREEAIAYCKEKGLPPEFQFFLVERELWGENHAYAEPLIKPEGLAQLDGGNWLYTSDSSGYNQGYCRTAFPIPIHDRFETWEQFQALGN